MLRQIFILSLVGYALADKAIHPPDLDHKSTIYNFDNLERQFCKHGENGKGKKDGNYAHPEHCDKFITCEHFEHFSLKAKVSIQSCPYGLYYNAKIGVCDWPRNVECFLYQGRTCFGGKRNRFGKFRASQTGYIKAMKLIHKKGYITCKYYQPTYKSFWGCNTEIGAFKYLVNTWITTTDDKYGVIFPTKTTPYDPYGNYELDGYDQLSPYVMWNGDPYEPTKVRRRQRLRIWYGEDLHDIHESDNRGRHCVDVYISYSYYKPDFFLNRRKS